MVLEQLLASDPFLFFRATPGLYHADLATHSGHKARSLLNPSKVSPQMTIGGDIHMANFGTFRAPSEKEAVWGVNDYDQTGTGSVDADLTRLATSLVLTARNNKLSSSDQKASVELLATKYFEEMRELASTGSAKGSAPYLAADKAKGKVKELVQKATERKRGKWLDKYTKLDTKASGGGVRSFLTGSDPELLVITDVTTTKSVTKVLTEKGFKVLQVIEKIGSGGSSNGLPRYWALIENPNSKKNSADKNPYILEVKCLLPPGLLHGKSPADGKALLARQKQMGGLVNPLSSYVAGGVTASDKRDYIIREIEPEKDSLKLETLSATDLSETVAQAAKVLARLHTLGGDKKLATSLQKWAGGSVSDVESATKRLREFALTYADQVAIDHAAYKAAVNK